MDDYSSRNRRILLEGTQALERTGDSIARSTQIAVESEQYGNEVLSDLGSQREALLRTKNRLISAEDQLTETKSILRKMKYNVLYNKAILIGIILIEITILGLLLYRKFFSK